MNKLAHYFFTLILLVFSPLFINAADQANQNDMHNLPPTYHNMRNLLDEHLRDNTHLLNSSQGRDIAVVLGTTGSGKSTLINYLMNLGLRSNDNEEIELVDPTNPLAMKIGDAGSTTLLPQCTQIGTLVVYDLPGFRDTRGTAVNLLSSSFIKHIIQNARSTRLIFVVGQDQMTSVRGESVRGLIQSANSLFPHNVNIIQSSLLVITKSINDTVETLIPYVRHRFLDIAELSHWMDTNRIAPMPKRNFGPSQRDTIIRKINEIPHSRINYVNIESIYSTDVRNDIRIIFSSEMTHFMQQVLGQAPTDRTTFNAIDNAKIFFESFEMDILQQINSSLFTLLLKPLAENIFESEKNEILFRIQEVKNLNITQLDLKKEQLEREENTRRHNEQLEIMRKKQAIIEDQNRALQEQIRRAEEQRKIDNTVKCSIGNLTKIFINNRYKIRNVGNNGILDNYDNSSDGAPIKLGHCNHHSNHGSYYQQLFELVNQGNNRYKIRNVGNGGILDTWGDSSEGAIIKLGHCNHHSNHGSYYQQLFEFDIT